MKPGDFPRAWLTRIATGFEWWPGFCLKLRMFIANRLFRVHLAIVLAAAAPLLASCATAYYRALETVGIEKREILVDRIEEARDSQTEAKEQFTSALDRYRSVVNVDPTPPWATATE